MDSKIFKHIMVAPIISLPVVCGVSYLFGYIYYKLPFIHILLTILILYIGAVSISSLLTYLYYKNNRVKK
jgi:hypothetical protein